MPRKPVSPDRYVSVPSVVQRLRKGLAIQGKVDVIAHRTLTSFQRKH